MDFCIVICRVLLKVCMKFGVMVMCVLFGFIFVFWRKVVVSVFDEVIVVCIDVWGVVVVDVDVEGDVDWVVCVGVEFDCRCGGWMLVIFSKFFLDSICVVLLLLNSVKFSFCIVWRFVCVIGLMGGVGIGVVVMLRWLGGCGLWVIVFGSVVVWCCWVLWGMLNIWVKFELWDMLWFFGFVYIDLLGLWKSFSGFSLIVGFSCLGSLVCVVLFMFFVNCFVLGRVWSNLLFLSWVILDKFLVVRFLF